MVAVHVDERVLRLRRAVLGQFERVEHFFDVVVAAGDHDDVGRLNGVKGVRVKRRFAPHGLHDGQGNARFMTQPADMPRAGREVRASARRFGQGRIVTIILADAVA